MIIFEGIDRCGKTTCASKLRQMLPDWSLRHFDYRDLPAFEYYANVLGYCSIRTILDRSFFSEMAYGPVCRGSSRISHGDRIKLELYAMANRAVVLHLIDDLTEVEKRWTAKEAFPFNWMEFVASGYDELMGKTRLPVIHGSLGDFNTTTPHGLTNIAVHEHTVADIEEQRKTPLPFIAAGQRLDADFIVLSSSSAVKPLAWGVEFPLTIGEDPETVTRFFEFADESCTPWDKGLYANTSRLTYDGLRAILNPNAKPTPLRLKQTVVICIDHESFVRAEAIAHEVGRWQKTLTVVKAPEFDVCKKTSWFQDFALLMFEATSGRSPFEKRTWWDAF